MASLLSRPSSTPRRSRKSHGSKQSKNPYSTRGLDKFSALLAELEQKRQKIYSQTDQEDVPLIRFVFTSSNECVPLVIKSQERSSNQEVKKKKSNDQSFKDEAINQESKFPTGSKSDSDKEMKKSELVEDKKPEKKGCMLNVKLHRLKRPSYYLPVTVILVLVFLALFGRSFAIMCTCIGWYIVPTIKGRSSNRKMSIKKKYYARRLSNENDGNNSMKKKDYVRKLSNESEGNNSMKKKDYVRKLSNDSKGSASPRQRDYSPLKDKFPCLAAHWKSG